MELSITTKCNNSKTCESSKRFGSVYICNHYNLETEFPKLKLEWHPDNENPLKEYMRTSTFDAKWICSEYSCCHAWTAKIINRTHSKGSNCPFCSGIKKAPSSCEKCNHIIPKRRKRSCTLCKGKKVCEHNNLKVLRSELVKEWDPSNTKPMKSYSVSSNVKVKWICSSSENCGCHLWEATINSRTGADATGCPYCARMRICFHGKLERKSEVRVNSRNNFATKYPHIAAEWSEKNFPLKPENVSFGSTRKVWWKCSKDPCGCHEWEATLNTRTNEGRGCPFCANQKHCLHNNLEAEFSGLKQEWHEDNPPMSSFSPYSRAKAKWKCLRNPCGCHEWEAVISSRTKSGAGCPFCANIKLCAHNNLKFKHPKLEKEWNPNNIHPMDFYAPGSQDVVSWICKENHMWFAAIKDRTGKRRQGCPHCCNSRKYSNIQIEWIESIERRKYNNPTCSFFRRRV